MSLNLNIKDTASFTRPASYNPDIPAKHVQHVKTWHPVLLGLVAFVLTFGAALGALLAF